MNFLLPFLEGNSLNNLCLVNSEWCETVRDFIRDFNKVIRMTVNPRDNIFHFLTMEATKLEKLELVWNTGGRKDNRLLNDVIDDNQGWSIRCYFLSSMNMRILDLCFFLVSIK